MCSCVKVVRECVERALSHFLPCSIFFQFEIKLFINQALNPGSCNFEKCFCLACAYDIVWLWHCMLMTLYDCDIVCLWHCMLMTLYDCDIVWLWPLWLWHCMIVTLCDCDIVWVWHCMSVTLYDCDIVWLWHCIIGFKEMNENCHNLIAYEVHACPGFNTPYCNVDLIFCCEYTNIVSRRLR